MTADAQVILKRTHYARALRDERKVRWLMAFGLILVLSALSAVALWRAFPAHGTDIGSDYAYVSWQMSRGAMLYHDVLGQQTPLLYVLGAVVYRLFPHPETFMAVALVVRIATVVGVLVLARACRFTPTLAVTACVCYLLLPMGFLFDARFEPNILITLGGVLCALALTRLSTGRALLAGIGCAVFILAKLTFAPLVLAFAAYLLLARRSLLPPFAGAVAATLLCSGILGYAVAGPSFVDGAFLARAGSTLSVHNFTMSLGYVWNVEGLTLLAALAGVLLALRSAGPQRLLAFYCIGALVTLGATVSVGSLAPEMLAAEPAMALCAALALRYAFVTWRQRERRNSITRYALVLCGLLVVVGQFLEARDDMVAVADARPSPSLACVVTQLQDRGRTSTPIIAPAYAAFLARRPLLAGLSDTFNWTVRVRRGDATARAQSRALVALIQRCEIGIVIVDDDHPLPAGVAKAVAMSYVPHAACPGVRAYRPGVH